MLYNQSKEWLSHTSCNHYIVGMDIWCSLECIPVTTPFISFVALGFLHTFVSTILRIEILPIVIHPSYNLVAFSSSTFSVLLVQEKVEYKCTDEPDANIRKYYSVAKCIPWFITCTILVNYQR